MLSEEAEEERGGNSMQRKHRQIQRYKEKYMYTRINPGVAGV